MNLTHASPSKIVLPTFLYSLFFLKETVSLVQKCIAYSTLFMHQEKNIKRIFRTQIDKIFITKFSLCWLKLYVVEVYTWNHNHIPFLYRWYSKLIDRGFRRMNRRYSWILGVCISTKCEEMGVWVSHPGNLNQINISDCIIIVLIIYKTSLSVQSTILEEQI